MTGMTMMTTGLDLQGCMFDFSGTLLRIEPPESWLRAVLAEAGIELPEAESAAYAQRLSRAGGQPGGASPESVPPALEPLWRERDLSAQHHRAAYTGLAREARLEREADLPWEDLYDALYDRHMEPAAWAPYPDTAEVLGELHGRGIPVAVVSNIGWDLRPVFAAHGLAELVDAFVLSYEFGRQKPDPAIFLAACEALGVAPQDTLMVGDDRKADGGAAALGCPVHFVDHLPAAGRPDALRGVLDLLA
jgi:putative hydrolase of the HAD superfamily